MASYRTNFTFTVRRTECESVNAVPADCWCLGYEHHAAQLIRTAIRTSSVKYNGKGHTKRFLTHF